MEVELVTLPIILVCDDDEGRREEWSSELRATDGVAGRFEVQVLGSDFLDEFRVLRSRRLAARADGRSPASTSPSRLDGTAVLVVDFDLVWFEHSFGESSDAYLTGEILCYLARCYSTVGAIVGVNQFGANPFNLELQDPLTSFADINIGEEQLTNPGLWGGSRTGFRPWAWPDLSMLPSLLERRTAEAAGRLSEDPLGFLGLPEDNTATLPRALMTDLETTGPDWTLRDVAASSPLGLRGGDCLTGDESAGRLLAARLGKWLEHRLVPAQATVIDAPHLVQRNAALLGEGAESEHAWQATCVLDESATEQFVESLRVHRWSRMEWASRPLWRLDTLLSDEALPGVRDPWDIPDLGLVFCEDLSGFLPREQARSFVVELPTASPTRYIADPDAIADELPELKEIEYRPSHLLSL